jgi:hypothetical protein
MSSAAGQEWKPDVVRSRQRAESGTIRIVAILCSLVVSLSGCALAAAAEESPVVVNPPAPTAGPIPIPYPNLNAARPKSLSGYTGFYRAQTVTAGVISVQNTIE